MAGNGNSLVRPQTAQNSLRIAAGSPLAIQGVFLEIIRERFREDAGLGIIWRPDITETDVVIEVAFNEETESRSQTPGVYVTKLDTVPGKVVIGDRVGVRLEDHCEGFGAIATVGIALDCVSNDEGESAVIGDIVQYMLLASQDVIQREFGFYDMTHPSLSQTQPFERDTTKWNTQLQFQVQFWIRWSQVPISPLLQQIATRISVNGSDVAGYFTDATINSLRRGEVLDTDQSIPGAELPPSRVSIVGPEGPSGPRGPQGTTGPAGPAGAIDLDQHETLDTLTHALAEDAVTDYTFSGKQLSVSTTWTDVGRTLKIRESTFAYTGKALTGVVTLQFDGLGATVTTLTKTLTYTGKQLQDVTVVRT